VIVRVYVAGVRVEVVLIARVEVALPLTDGVTGLGAKEEVIPLGADAKR
jgi:hypothetical protein